MAKKPLKPKKCKVCGNQFTPFSSLAKACSPKCAIELVRNTAQKAREKAEKKRLKERKAKLKSRAEWLKEAQKVFNQFIRLRDKDEPCISCGRFDVVQWHAGHYRTTKAAPELRFCELNVHKQCSQCNDYLSGNIPMYRPNLIAKIGLAQVEWLERYDHELKKFTVEDCKEIIQYYKAKIKELSNEY